MAQTETFQLSAVAAEAYESTFVPALFAEWAPHLCDLAGVRPGQRVLDVACGTGIVARVAADRLAGAGRVVGVDLNEAMLAVARRVRPDLEWRQGDAEALPFPPASFDRVLCQMALMFFPDRARALREMRRVAAPDGVAAFVVPATPGRSARLRALRRDGDAPRRPGGRVPPERVLRLRRPPGAHRSRRVGRPSRHGRSGPTPAARDSTPSTRSWPPRSRARRCSAASAAKSTGGSGRARGRCSGRSRRPRAASRFPSRDTSSPPSRSGTGWLAAR